MLESLLTLTIQGHDGIVLIDMDDTFECWYESEPSYWVMKKLAEVAKGLDIPIFLDKRRGDKDDEAWANFDILTRGWININRFDCDLTAQKIEETLGKPRNETTLGFGGSYAEVCVMNYLHSLCAEKVIPNVPRTRQQEPDPDIIRPRFNRGKLLFELTENPYVSIFKNPSVLDEVRPQLIPYNPDIIK